MHSDKLHKFIWLLVLKTAHYVLDYIVGHSNEKIKFYIPIYTYTNIYIFI